MQPRFFSEGGGIGGEWGGGGGEGRGGDPRDQRSETLTGNMYLGKTKAKRVLYTTCSIYLLSNITKTLF